MWFWYSAFKIVLHFVSYNRLCHHSQHVGKIFSLCRVSIASAIIQPLKVTPFFHPLSWLSFQWVSRRYFLHRWCKLFCQISQLNEFSLPRVQDSLSLSFKKDFILPFILYIDSASLFNHFLFYICSAIS
jgi:hypothetical protein